MRLVPLTSDHFDTLRSWFATEAEATRWGGPDVRFPLDAPQLEAMLAEGRGSPPARLCWMAEDAAGGIAGHAQLGFDWRNGNARLGRVAVAPGMRGRGLAQPMLALVIGEGFARAGIERIELNVYTFNTPAIRTYEALGFRHEGVRRSSVRVGAERWDTAHMGLLRAERPAG